MPAVTLDNSQVTISGATPRQGIAGEEIKAGQPIYVDGSDDNKIKLAVVGDTDAKAACKGVAANHAYTGQHVGYTRSTFTLTDASAPFTKDQAYCVGATKGTIVPESDLATGNQIVRLGTTSSTSVLKGDIEDTGITHS